MIAANPAHAPVLAALHASSFPPREAWEAAFFTQQLGFSGSFALIADGGAGMILVRVAADEAEVLSLAVHPAQRRCGVGRLLLEEAAAEAARRGAAAVYLEVSDRNDAARRLYMSAGFEEVGRRLRYYDDGADALLMRRSLARS
jgi:ribosomal-protein-alanine N-acetyltransferase